MMRGHIGHHCRHVLVPRLLTLKDVSRSLELQPAVLLFVSIVQLVHHDPNGIQKQRHLDLFFN